MVPVSLSPFALIVPRPTVPLTSAPRTPSRSPIASHILLSPPSANRNSTDSWNSSNYDFDDPNAVWKEDQVRLLNRVGVLTVTRLPPLMCHLDPRCPPSTPYHALQRPRPAVQSTRQNCPWYIGCQGSQRLAAFHPGNTDQTSRARAR